LVSYCNTDSQVRSLSWVTTVLEEAEENTNSDTYVQVQVPKGNTGILDILRESDSLLWQMQTADRQVVDNSPK
jgi:hypothetical protein